MKSIKSVLKVVLIFSGLLSAISVKAQTWDPYPDSLEIRGNHLNHVSYPFRAGQFLRFFQFDLGTKQVRFDTADIFEVVKQTQLIGLKDSINDPKDKKSYAALRVIYGLKVDQALSKAKLVFIYVPVLIRLNDKTPGDIDTFDVIPGGNAIPPGEENHYYILNNQGNLEHVEPAQLNEVKEWIGFYKRYIRIDPKGTGSFRSYDLNDALSETFPFKSLEHYFSPFDTLYVTCGAKQAEELGVDTYRHYVAFANIPFDVTLNSVTTHAADLGTLCPPNCLITRVLDGRPLSSKSTGKIVAIIVAIISAAFGIYQFFSNRRRKLNRL